jgi:hypothetical protein
MGGNYEYALSACCMWPNTIYYSRVKLHDFSYRFNVFEVCLAYLRV